MQKTWVSLLLDWSLLHERESVTTFASPLEPLAVFPDTNVHVVHCVQSCCFEADCGLDWVVPKLAEVCLEESTFRCGYYWSWRVRSYPALIDLLGVPVGCLLLGIGGGVGSNATMQSRCCCSLPSLLGMSRSS